jgi:Ca2+-binding EF-hand superfamily protein
MDISNVGSAASQGVQQLQGHHHHRMGMSQRLDKMESAIDQAVTNGNLTDDQATQMKKMLEDIKKTLADAKTSGTPLTSDQLKEIRKELQDIGKQLFSAIKSTQGSTTAAPDPVAELFKKIDADSNGSIDKNELTDFVNQLKNHGANPTAANETATPATYNQKGSFSFSMSMSYQSTISYSA